MFYYSRMGNDNWGWTDPENGDEYVLMGTSGGTSFVRINDPTDPEVIAFMYGRSVPTSLSSISGSWKGSNRSSSGYLYTNDTLSSIANIWLNGTSHYGIWGVLVKVTREHRNGNSIILIFGS